jgi:hypothetical protein
VTWLGWLAAAWPWHHANMYSFLKKKLQHVQYSMQNKWVKDDPSNG